MKIIKIHALWCSSCLYMNTIWNKIEKSYNLDIQEYDYDINKDLIRKYQVTKNIPVYIFLNKEEKEIYRIEGEISLKKLNKIIGELHEKY